MKYLKLGKLPNETIEFFLIEILKRKQPGIPYQWIHFDEYLNNEFGDRLGCEYTADHQFSIDGNGNWTAQHNYKFLQTDLTWSDKSFNHTWGGSGQW